MLGRLVQSADFERVLASPARSRSVHFAIHHVAKAPACARRTPELPVSTELSTGTAPPCAQPVDQLPGGCWLGTVVPKRHARRSVTRNLVKRQMREAMNAHAAQLAPGLWVLRLKAPFDRQKFPSAASDALRELARGELGQLLQRLPRAA
jgi:ribonuclease P protein component